MLKYCQNGRKNIPLNAYLLYFLIHFNVHDFPCNSGFRLKQQCVDFTRSNMKKKSNKFQRIW